MNKHQLTPNHEWGSQARKEEDRLRGNNNSDRRAAIAEQLEQEAQEDIVRLNTAEWLTECEWADWGGALQMSLEHIHGVASR